MTTTNSGGVWRYRCAEFSARRLRVPLRCLPAGLQRIGLELMLNHGLRDALAADDFDFLEGRCLAVEVSDLGYRWPLAVCQKRLVVLGPGAHAEACIRGECRALLRLAARCEDPDSFFFQRQLSIEGDTELALAVKNRLDGIEPEQLPPPMSLLLSLLARHFSQETSADNVA